MVSDSLLCRGRKGGTAYLFPRGNPPSSASFPGCVTLDKSLPLSEREKWMCGVWGSIIIKETFKDQMVQVEALGQGLVCNGGSKSKDCLCY